MEEDRCFLALRIPEVFEYQKKLKDISHDLNVKLSIVPPEKYHFTLHFFGDTSKSLQEKVVNKLSNFEIEIFKLSLKATGTIPPKNPKKTRVLYIEPDAGRRQLINMVMQIRSKLAELQISMPKREYLPHLTVARVRHGKDIRKLHDIWKRQEFREVEFGVNNFELIKSDLTTQGPVYTTLKKFE